ncbi:hypothetical protein KP79_PYT24497 [Mizuhopecten yessoensis]|uniref:Ubiquitin-like protease family profile domain-containing protein n=2 Tax=Mizuhopecten yessoensis TaxID=6573 RepID=A0A210QN56_MIZYE|nr:hypothetical protein KP79_PYT24497 [Mizuhopecten yessoensis]
MDARLSLLDNKNPIKWTRGQTQSSVPEDGSSCGVFVLMNAEAVTKNVPPRLMRQCHVHTYRQHELQRLISSSTTLEVKMKRCDLPFCSNPVKSERKHQRSQCPSCEKWSHKFCLGLDEDQLVNTCMFCC